MRTIDKLEEVKKEGFCCLYVMEDGRVGDSHILIFKDAKHVLDLVRCEKTFVWKLFPVFDSKQRNDADMLFKDQYRHDVLEMVDSCAWRLLTTQVVNRNDLLVNFLLNFENCEKALEHLKNADDISYLKAKIEKKDLVSKINDGDDSLRHHVAI